MSRRNDTVAVIGCGGVGDAAIAGAALVGARTIIAVDTDNRKLAWAREFGATHTINAKELDASQTDLVTAIEDLTDGFGADVVIDAVGRPDTWNRPSTLATWRARSSWSAYRPRRCSSTCRWSTSSPAAGP